MERVHRHHVKFAFPMKKPKYKLDVYRTRRGKWRWRVRHVNGKVLFAATEAYTRRCDALRPLRGFIQQYTGQWWA